MNKIIKSLGAWGCDIKGAMERMGDDEEFYIECLNDVTQDPCFAALKTAMDTGDIAGMFASAHTLKGVFANVGLTPMYNKAVEIVEPLRGGGKENLNGKYAQLMKMKARLANILAKK